MFFFSSGKRNKIKCTFQDNVKRAQFPVGSSAVYILVYYVLGITLEQILGATIYYYKRWEIHCKIVYKVFDGKMNQISCQDISSNQLSSLSQVKKIMKYIKI